MRLLGGHFEFEKHAQTVYSPKIIHPPGYTGPRLRQIMYPEDLGVFTQWHNRERESDTPLDGAEVAHPSHMEAARHASANTVPEGMAWVWEAAGPGVGAGLVALTGREVGGRLGCDRWNGKGREGPKIPAPVLWVRPPKR